MSLYVRVYVEVRNVAPSGDYVTHEVTSFQPAQIHNNDPEDSSSDPGYCVETVCGDQLLVTAIHTRWPDGKRCQECDGSVPPDPSAPRFDFGGVRNVGLYRDGGEVKYVEGGVNVGTARALDDACSACGAQVFETPSGLVCVNGHGGPGVIP